MYKICGSGKHQLADSDAVLDVKHTENYITAIAPFSDDCSFFGRFFGQNGAILIEK
jgi:hypothetical protein